MDFFPDPSAALKHFFGFDEFLDGQKEVVETILAGEDVVAIMPTGAGKSICYQLPVLMKEGYGIVASPLIALMCDQVENLCRKGIPATFVNSTLTLQKLSHSISADDYPLLGSVRCTLEISIAVLRLF